MPLFPILLYFSITGLKILRKNFIKHKKIVTSVFVLGILMNLVAIPIYTFGGTNYFIDQQQEVLPNDLGLSSEKLFSLSEAIKYINKELPQKSVIILTKDRKLSWSNENIFRKDIQLISWEEQGVCRGSCYYIERDECENSYLFRTDNYPRYCVKRYQLVN